MNKSSELDKGTGSPRKDEAISRLDMAGEEYLQPSDANISNEVNVLSGTMSRKSPELNNSDTYSWISEFSPLDNEAALEPSNFDQNDILWLFSIHNEVQEKHKRVQFTDNCSNIQAISRETPTYSSRDMLSDASLTFFVASNDKLCADFKQDNDVWKVVKENIMNALFRCAEDESNFAAPRVTLPRSHSKDFENTDFFRPETIKRLFHLYFEIFHDHFPILHKPSFMKGPESIHPLLVVAIITLGAFHDSFENYEVAVELHENFRWVVFSILDLIPPKLWAIQTLALIQAFEKMASTRKQHELSATFHSAVITLLRRDGSCANMRLVKEQTSDDLQQQWETWIEKESIKRCVFFPFYDGCAACCVIWTYIYHDCQRNSFGFTLC